MANEMQSSFHIRVPSQLALVHKLGGKRIRLSPPRKRKDRDLDGKRSIIIVSPQLPEELIGAEILTRLPIKSVVRFNCVCKSWLSLFSNPQFVKQHSIHQSPNDYDCLVADRSRNIVILSRNEEIFSFRRDQLYYLVGSANGLVCIRRNKILSLWNPAIHKSKEFHLPQPLGSNCLNIMGLGFDPVSNDYKVAICYRSGSFDSSRFGYAVYSSHSDSWIHYHFDGPDYEMLITKFEDSRNPTTMVKDSPYWTSSPSSNRVILSLDVLKFDATTNKFKLLPQFSANFGNEKIYKVVSMRDLLTLMAYEPCTTGKLDVYSLDEEKGCGGVWSKMYRFGPFETFWRFRNLQQGFKYGDEIVFHDYMKIYRYYHKTDTLECIPGSKPVTFVNCFTYTPSLVFLQGMTSIYLEDQSLPLGHQSTTPQRSISSLTDK